VLIISKYKDYYDSAVGFGIDKSIVYHRQPSNHDAPDDFLSAIKETNNPLYYQTLFSFTNHYRSPIPTGKYNSDVVFVGFCGKLYLAICFSEDIPSYSGFSDRKCEFVYDVDQIKEKLRPEWKSNSYFVSSNEIESKFDNYVKKINSIDPIKWFREFNTPSFVYGSLGIDSSNARWQSNYDNTKNGIFYIDPILNDYQFARVFDPYTAFQETQMFISGVLPFGDNVDQLPYTEKQKVAQHGMDKWSFRKEPHK
jgi:hypothetical protein